MATRMQQRRGTAAQWLSTNNGNGPVLNIGEIGYESDTNKFKIGDGVSHWIDLNYFADAVELGGSIDDYIPLTQKGVANGVATLNSNGVIPSEQIPSLVGLDSEITTAVNNAVTSLVGSAPDALNTLQELAAAIDNDDTFSSTIVTALGTKQEKVAGVTSTEIGYLDGVTSSIQTQIDSKLASNDLISTVDTALFVGAGLTQTYDNNDETITINLDSTIPTKTEVAEDITAHNQETELVHGIADTAELATKTFAANLLVNATKTNIQITGDKDGITIVAENGVADSTTDNLSEGSTNKYYTDARVETKLSTSVRDGIEWDGVTKELYVDETTVQFRVADVTDTEIGYLNGVTSSIQDQLDDKASITGTETLENKTLINPVVTYRELTQSSITMLYANNAAFYEFKDSSGTTFMGPNGQNGWFYPEASHTIYLEDYPDLTTIRIVNSMWNQIFNGTIAQAVSGGYITYDDGSNDYTVSPIELYRLDGVTSNIQSQLNSKASTTNLSDHAANTSTHGVAGSIVGTDSIQTLTNKTLFNPEITVQEVTTPGSLTLKDGYIYTFIKPDDSTYPSPNGQNNLWSIYDAQVVLLSQIPLATRTNVISTTTWNSVGTFTFAQADTQNYLDYQPTITADTAISNIEIKYLDGVTSNIQDQLDDKSAIASPTFTGTVTTDDLVVDGDFTVNGTNFAASATSITIEDNLVQLAHQNVANTVDLGIVVGYNDGSAKHAGIVRDVSDSKWKLFKDVTTEPSTTVAFGEGSLDDLAVAGLEATSISATSATIGDVSNTELQYLNGVTSAIQTQLDSKLDSSTASSTYQAIVSGVSDTEIGYLDGVTSAIQTQLNAKAPTADPTFTGTVSGVTKSHVGLGNVDNTSDANKPVSTATQTALDAKANALVSIDPETASYTLVLSNSEQMVEMNVGSANTLTVPTNSSVAFPIGTRIHVVQTGSGQTTITPASGVTINGTPGLKTRAQWSAVTLVKRATDTWIAFGDLTA